MKSNLLREATRIAFEKHGSHPMKGRGYTVFSFAVEKNKILGFGVNNRDRTVPAHFGYDKRSRGWGIGFETAEHSEISAWRKCRGLITGHFDLINIRITDGGKIALSCPCSCCIEWLKANDCSSVIFSTDSQWARMRLI
jgi:hypothetical protein